MNQTLMDAAVAALYAAGALTRDDARRQLPAWRWYGGLSAAERAAVLDRFDAEDWPASLHSRPELHPGTPDALAPWGIGPAAGVGPPALAASHTTPGHGATRGADAGVDAAAGGLRPPAWAEVAGCRGLAASAPNSVGDRHT